MSGSYLAGVDSRPAGGDGGDVVGEEVEEVGEEEVEEEEEQQDDLMESRGPSQQDGVRSSDSSELWQMHQPVLFIVLWIFFHLDPGVSRGAKGL